MTQLYFAIVVVALGTVTAAARQSDRPPLPYVDWGACPFECCTYREWTANAPLKAFRARNSKGPVAFEVKKGESVRGVTGVVITSQYGVSKVLKPMQLGYRVNGEKPELSLQPGELLYTLHNAGEGMDLFWYKGKVYFDQISGDQPDPDPPPPELNIQILALPQYVWWVKIRNAKGQVGWSQEVEKFDHMDACE